MIIQFYGDWLPKASRFFEPTGCCRIGNLECAFSDRIVESGKAYTSILPTRCMDFVGTSGFYALSVANNHVNDAGNFDETIATLKARFPEIQFFGMIDKPYAEFENDGRKIYIIGCLEPCRSRGTHIFQQERVEKLIRTLRDESPACVVYIYPHWGKEGEYTRYPTPWQQKLARRWIDAGAYGVFGSHSHVPQGREYYKCKPIYYSLGNFDFDHPESKLYPGTSDRLVVRIDMASMIAEEIFNCTEARISVEKASAVLKQWSNWKWAKMVGPFNLRKNTASWKMRLRKNFIATLPKFLAWQILPQTILFRLASLCR